jgi:DNA-directed RNA polymerase specialized sigma24 family protein
MSALGPGIRQASFKKERPVNIGSEMKSLSQHSMPPFRARQSNVATQSFDTGDEFADQESSADRAIEQFAFDELLSWLAPDPEAAGRQYELIRQKLITLFTFRGSVFPDELADETISRVTRKLPQIKPNYTGSPVRYFYGVAKRVYLEQLHRVPVQKVLPPPPLKEDSEELFQRLDYALGKLEQSDRELILSYYQGDGHEKIDHRKDLARQMGVGLNTLRLRIYRIKSQLRSHFDMQE